MAEFCCCSHCVFCFKNVCTNIDCDECGQSIDNYNQDIAGCCGHFVEKPRGMMNNCHHLDNEEEDNWFD